MSTTPTKRSAHAPAPADYDRSAEALKVSREDLRDAPAPEPKAEIRTAEQWAEAKGMLPQFSEGGTLVAKPGLTGAIVQGLGGRLGNVAPRANPNFWKFAAARAHNVWPEGKELTEHEFDAAVESATNTPI